MRRNLMLLAVAAATLTAATPTLAQPGQSCFFVTQWNGWKAAGDHTIYLNVAGNRIYRLDMRTFFFQRGRFQRPPPRNYHSCRAPRRPRSLSTTIAPVRGRSARRWT